MKQVISFLPNLFKLVGGLMGDRRVPFFEKLLVVGLLVYVLFPLDLVPDLIPLAGQLDDLLLAAVVIQRLLNRADPETLSQYWNGSPMVLEWLRKFLDKLLFFLPAGVKGTPPRNPDVIDVDWRIKE